MSPSPTNARQVNTTQAYAASWRAIMQLVRNGSSWSGRERNCVFLNCTESAVPTTPPRFANFSAISALDFPDDGRAIAVVDWDRDGDLDVWFRNRTAPRLRLMRNRSRQLDSDRPYVSLLLRGRRSNRDAIGARVEVLLTGRLARPERKFVQTVQAGDGFMSQSSKWLHFALPSASHVRQVVVNWPGGGREVFSNVKSPGRYQLAEDTGNAKAVHVSHNGALRAAPLERLSGTGAARIVLPGRIRLPTLGIWETRSGQRQHVQFQPSGQPTLLLFWSSRCLHCRHELAEYGKNAHDFEQANVRLLAICLDGVKATLADSTTPPPALDSQARSFLEQASFPFSVVQTNAASIDRLQQFQNSLFDRYPEFVVPYAILTDGQGHVVTIYRGTFPASRILSDTPLLSMTNQSLRDLAVPLPGSWLSKPATYSQFAEYVGQRMYRHEVAEGLRYLKIAQETAQQPERRAQLRKQLVQIRRKQSRQAKKGGSRQEARSRGKATE